MATAKLRFLLKDQLSRMKNLLIALLLVVLANAISDGKTSIESLSTANIKLAKRYYQDKWNNGYPLFAGGVDVILETGETVSDNEISLLVLWLVEKNKLPQLRDLEPLLEHDNKACRIFCKECLKFLLRDIPEYSPYFKPGSEPAKILEVRKLIRIRLKGTE